MVKIVSLEIKKLHGVFDYDVKFNPDVTFLYGINGCGKTTILNITEAIITGQLYNLFKYNFSKIKLSYSFKGQLDNEKEILILYSDENTLTIVFNNTENIIEYEKDFQPRNSIFKKYGIENEIQRFYFEKYPFLDEINSTFNYVYLSLNRTSVNNHNEYSMPYHEFTPIDIPIVGRNDNKITDVEALIRENYMIINNDIRKCSDKFRNKVLKSLLEVNSISFLESLQGFQNQNTSNKQIDKIQTSYLKILKELNLLTATEESTYNSFFEDFTQKINLLNNKKGKSDEIILSIYEDIVGLAYKYQEINKIKKIVEIYEKSEKEKAIVYKPIETFLSTINDFIANEKDDKKIIIDEMGIVRFVTKYSDKPISIKFLSSGEKQLLIFFSNLIFNVKRGKSGIFVVDEPELSLHLHWQRIFVEKTLSINSDLQLIFATHAPEIIGNKRDKMYKLEKEYSGQVVD